MNSRGPYLFPAPISSPAFPPRVSPFPCFPPCFSPQTAYGGMATLAHALESFISVFASDYSRGLSKHALTMTTRYYARAYTKGALDYHAREKVGPVGWRLCLCLLGGRGGRWHCGLAGWVRVRLWLSVRLPTAMCPAEELPPDCGTASAFVCPRLFRTFVSLPPHTSWPSSGIHCAPSLLHAICVFSPCLCSCAPFRCTTPPPWLAWPWPTPSWAQPTRWQLRCGGRRLGGGELRERD